MSHSDIMQSIYVIFNFLVVPLKSKKTQMTVKVALRTSPLTEILKTEQKNVRINSVRILEKQSKVYRDQAKLN